MKRSAAPLALVVLIALGGCDMSVTEGEQKNDDPTYSMVKGGKGTLDLRTRPTRADLGMGRSGFVSYPAKTGGDPVNLTLELPGGTVHGSFFQIDAGVDGAFTPDRDPRHPPKAFDLYQRVPDRDAAVRLLQRNADALGLKAADIDDVTAQGTSVVDGLIKDWLSLEVQVRGQDDGSLVVIYSIAIDTYHNPAVDKVLHDGAVTLDLTHRPTREDLGFLPDYDSATIEPEPHQRLEVTVRTPRGEVVLPSIGVMSSESPLYVSLISLPSPERARTILQAAGTALGFDAAEAQAFADAAHGDLAQKEFSCSLPGAASCDFRVQVTTATGEGKQYSLRLRARYS